MENLHVQKQNIIQYQQGKATIDQQNLETNTFISKQQFSNVKKYITQHQKQSKQGNKKTSYRPDIDGLRTLAIVIVVIFHAWPDFLTGGFIGVDVFFVISGYLITEIILKQTKRNNFSYIQFYSRRIKRIYPALITVLIFVFIIGINYLPVKNLQIMSKTMAASTIFSANLQILTYEQDYFAPQVKTNPLLHLWSLGVEQQFYIFWPFLMSLAVKITSEKARIMLEVFAMGSFLFNIFNVQENAKFAFYFPLCRFWQMAIGGSLAYFNIPTIDKVIKNILSIASFCVILYTSFTIDEDSLFPGFWALVPTLSSAFIILAGQQSYLNNYILSNKIIVFLGKISYPLYLWHWPLIVFSRLFYQEDNDQIFAQMWIVVLFSILFAIATYFLIQNNLRFTKNKKVVLCLLISMILICFMSIYTYKNPQKISFQQDQGDLQDQQNGIQPDQNNLQTNQFNLEDQKIELQFHKSSNLNVSLFQKFGINLSRNYEQQIVPTQEDYYIKNGVKIPNSSKNPKRVVPDIKKIRYTVRTVSYYNSKLAPLHLESVSTSSKYHQKIPWRGGRFDVINQGRQNQLFLIGDSFAQFIGWRFRKLYDESLQRNQLHKFPTIVHIVERGRPFFHCARHFKFVKYFVNKHKPKRILLSYHLIHQLAFNPKLQPREKHDKLKECTPIQKKYSRRAKSDVQKDLEISAKVLRQFVDLGVEVYVVGIHPTGGNLNPEHMSNGRTVRSKKIQPVRLSTFRQHNSQDSMKQAGAKIVDFTQNQCWNDLCQVALPSGYPLFIDHSHYSVPNALYWLSAVDFLTKF